MLEDYAEEHDVVEQDGKLQIPTSRLGMRVRFATGENRTLAAFRHSYNSTADETLTAGSFYPR